MSADKEPKEKKKKKGSGLMLKLAIPVVLLGAGGGGMYGLFAAGIIGGGAHEKIKEDNNPKLVRKGEEDPFAPKAEGGKEGEGAAAEVEGDGGSQYKTSYFTFSEEYLTLGAKCHDVDLILLIVTPPLPDTVGQEGQTGMRCSGDEGTADIFEYGSHVLRQTGRNMPFPQLRRSEHLDGSGRVGYLCVTYIRVTKIDGNARVVIGSMPCRQPAFSTASSFRHWGTRRLSPVGELRLERAALGTALAHEINRSRRGIGSGLSIRGH